MRRLSELPGSPFRADPSVIELLSPNGTARLYEVTRELQSIVSFSIGSEGQLTVLGETVDVEDTEGRDPAGAAYFRFAVDDGDPDQDEDEDNDE